MTDALVSTGLVGQQARRLLAEERGLHVPAILSAEVTSALRSMLRRGLIDDTAALVATSQVARLRARRYPFEPFVSRVWELRETVTPYDAWYVALAEQLGAELVTGDGRLQRATGPRCRVLSTEEALSEA